MSKSPARQTKQTTAREKHLQKRYGIAVSEYEKLYAEQGGACAGCGYQPKPGGRRLAVDHDHKTGAVRGLLCWRCNTLLGWAKDSPRTLRRLADYLERTEV